jgi:vanillate O-demethylase ferredoxin subunit
MMHAWMDVVVVAKRREAEDIFSFELADPSGGELPPHSAGAHIDVELGPDLVRQYSLCTPQDHRDRYQIAVLREPASRGGSVALHDRVQVGDRLRISEPKNHFPLAAGASRSILIAGGIGITPILCMAERLVHLGEPFTLHYASRSPSRMAFRERIATSPLAQNTLFHFDDGPPEQVLKLDEAIPAPATGSHLYVCGPGGLIDAVLRKAKARGWPDEQVHREFFAAPAVDPSVAEGGAFQIKIASTGRVFDVPEGKPITTVLAENGVFVQVSCQQGVCGTCLTSVLEGIPEHHDVYLLPEEQAQNDQILPCCARSKSAMLVLDL